MNRIGTKRIYLIIAIILISSSIVSCANRSLDKGSEILSENNSNDRSDINQYYAGSYFNGEGKLICCYTDQLEAVKEYFEIPAKFIQVNYNVNQLSEAYEKFIPILGQYEIQSVGISYSDNTTIVTLYNYNHMEEIRELVNCEVVIFQLALPGFSAQFTY